MTPLILRRIPGAWQDRLRSYRVIVDGQEVARIANGAEVTIPLAPGGHVVHLRVDWCRSPLLRITVAPGQPAILECGPNAKPWFALVYITLLRHKYLWLRPAGQKNGRNMANADGSGDGLT